MKRITWFIFLLFLGISCLEEPDCYQLENDRVGIAFRVMGSSVADTVALEEVWIDGLDSIFYKNVLATRISLPVNFFKANTTVKVKTPKQTFTTLLGYRVQTQFVTENCSPRYLISELQNLSSDFDSVRIINTSPGKSQPSNIEVFRCPVPNTLTLTFNQLTLTGREKASRAAGVDINGITIENFIPVLYPNARATTVYLPLNPEATSTTYNFTLGDVQKQLQIDYTTTTETRYKQCGVQTFFSDLKITSSNFDSTSVALDANKVFKNKPLDPPSTNISLYTCPQSNLVRISFRKPGTVANTTVQDTPALLKISADYTNDVFYQNQEVSTVDLPLNKSANATTFTIEYANGKTETVSLAYATQAVFKNACKDVLLINELRQAVTLPNVRIVRADLTSPATTNIEITN